MNTFNFTDRTSYLAYRAGWKEYYAGLSGQIRSFKVERRTAKGDQMGAVQSRLHYLSIEATEKLAELVEAKLEAGRQYAADRQHQVAA